MKTENWEGSPLFETPKITKKKNYESEHYEVTVYYVYNIAYTLYNTVYIARNYTEIVFDCVILYR